MMKKKDFNDFGELLACFGIAGAGIFSIIIMAILLVAVIMLIPATVVWGILYFLLPSLGITYYVSFLQCWLACILIRFVGSLFFGNKIED